MKAAILFLIAFVVALAVGAVSGLLTSFNSATPLNITFNNTNYTLFLNIPNSIFISNVTFNITSISTEGNIYSYQEVADNSRNTSQWINLSYINDSDYSTYATRVPGQGPQQKVNYTKPYADARAIWQIKDDGSPNPINYTLPDRCQNRTDNKVCLNINIGGPVYWNCLDYEDALVNVVTSGSEWAYEEAIFWNMSDRYSVTIKAGDGISQTFEFNTTNSTDSSIIATLDNAPFNNILSENCNCTLCSVSSGYCNLSIYFNTLINQTIQVQLSGNYSYSLDNCTNIDNIPSNGTSLNISIYDLSDTLIDTDYEYVLDYGLTTSYGYNFSTSGYGNNITICKYPSWGSIYSDGLIDYNKTFTYNLYQLNLTNITQDVSLVLPQSGTTIEATSEVLFTVLDSYDNEIENAFIQIQLYDIDSNSYKTTEILETDSQGQATGNIILATKYYRFIIIYEGEIKLINPETQGIKIYATERIFRINLISQEWYGNEDEVNDLTSAFAFNATGTNNFVFEWVNPTGTSVTGCMEIIQRNQTATTNIYSGCTTSAGASIVHGITPTSCNTYTGIAYLDYSGSIYSISNSPIEISVACDFTFKDVKGEDGNRELVFLSWMVIIALAFIGIVMPEISLILATVGLIGVVAVGFLSMAWQWVVGWIVMVILVVLKHNKK